MRETARSLVVLLLQPALLPVAATQRPQNAAVIWPNHHVAPSCCATRPEYIEPMEPSVVHDAEDGTTIQPSSPLGAIEGAK